MRASMHATATLAIVAVGGCAGEPLHAESAPASTASEPPPIAAAATHTALDVPLGHQLRFQAEGKGVQIYVCHGSDANTGWVLQAPEAELFDASGKVTGKHYAGPTWEAADGSRVVATKVRDAAPEASAIPWLLLRATSHDGAGLLAAVTFIQRRDTTGGVAPGEACDAAHSGETARVPYTAMYYFYEHGR